MKDNSTLVYKDPKELKFIEGNRLVDVRHIHKLMKAMSQRNMLDLCPILINKGGYIIDGQHRVTAAMSLGIKQVPCVISEGASLADAQELNQRGKNWGPRDFAFSYATLGNESYKRFRDFLKDTGLRYTVALLLIEGRSASRARLTTFKTGQFEFDKEMEKEAYRRIELLEDFKDYLPEAYNSKAFVQAFVIVEGHEDYEHSKMMGKLKKYSRKLHKSGDNKLYIGELERIYNLGEKVKVRFHQIGSASAE